MNMCSAPYLVLLNETFLPPESKAELTGYTLAGQRDRWVFGEDKPSGGGIAVFVCGEQDKSIPCVLISPSAERMWFCVQLLTCRVLVCCWYRRPEPNETTTIASLATEYQSLADAYSYSIIIGDCNVHEPTWLRFSNHSTVEGRLLWDFSRRNALTQKIKAPTRDNHLLDLLLTNAPTKKCDVHYKISDHCCIHATFALKLKAAPPLVRLIRRWDLADWSTIHARLDDTNWYYLVERSLDQAAEWFSDQVFECMDDLVPLQRRHFQNRGHAWITPSILRMVKRKHAGAGTTDYRYLTRQCNDKIWGSFCNYSRRTRMRLGQLKRGSKLWWGLAKRATSQSANPPGVGPLCKNNTWAVDDASKCAMLAAAFENKYQLPPRQTTQFSPLPDKRVNFYLPHVQPFPWRHGK